MNEILKKMIDKSIEELTTPAIVVDIDLLNINLHKMDQYFNDRNSKLRPHFKSTKCVTLAKKQKELQNCVGITCAKLSEAEQLVWGGIDNVLIANQVIGVDKTDRIAKLNKDATVYVAVDSIIGIEQLSNSAIKNGVEIGVFVEVDIGMNRGGVKPGNPALDLADIISRKEGLDFIGLQSYEGHIVTLPDYDERKQRVRNDMQPLFETKKLLEQKGYSSIISSGGTGTYDITGSFEEIDELQCGSYALMDSAYKTIRPEFENARYIFATVISKRDNTISTDVGLKGMGAEYGNPVIIGHPSAENLYVAEEHTVFKNVNVNIGDKLKIIPPHGCTTNNLYAKMWVGKNDKIIDVWEIEGNGCIE